jgi:hypothetical protein
VTLLVRAVRLLPTRHARKWPGGTVWYDIFDSGDSLAGGFRGPTPNTTMSPPTPARFGLRHACVLAAVAWWPGYTSAESLGRPTGAYRLLRNGVYRREFTNGVVLVNPHERTSRVVLGGTYSGSWLDKVTDASLKPISSVVLVRS